MGFQTFTLHQRNMYCSKCLLNVMKALSSIEYIKEMQICLEDKRIFLTYSDNKIGRKKLKKLINAAIAKGQLE